MTLENRALAVNHGGWQVEVFDPKTPEKGWYPAIEEYLGETDGYQPLAPHKTEDDANEFMKSIKEIYGTRTDIEFRVYPVALEKAKK